MPGHDIFISYCREERAAARQFAESFAREGFSVWWDAVLRSGQTFDEIIEQELRAAKAVVVLWSPRSVRSRWVRAEATLADRGNKLVPIIIEPCDLPIIFELTHAAELAEWAGDTTDVRWQTLISDLRRMVGEAGESVSEARPAPKSEPKREEPAAKPASDHPDEVIRALDRIGKAQESALAKPTPAEEAQAEFYKRSDEYREQEGGKVHCLLRLDGEEQETRFAVTAAGLTIGRTAPADVIVPGAGVSRAHCQVELAADQLRITDLNSTNGTFVDNKRIAGSEMLAVGSVLRVGNVSFEHIVRMRDELEPRVDPMGFEQEARRRAAGLASH